MVTAVPLWKTGFFPLHYILEGQVVPDGSICCYCFIGINMQNSIEELSWMQIHT
uniref:Uncharacterized protein n=1 Tax=Anguilla anguilla TaxID=7936 RepID=A0A0E9WHU8_ANGAN